MPTVDASTRARWQDMARAQTREVLTQSPSFLALDVPEQRIVYQQMVNDHYDKLAGTMATDSGKDMGYKGYDPGFSGDTQSFNELVDSVDFPSFVSDLLKAVFSANLDVMKKQTDAYIKLMKEASKPAADFIKQVKDDDTFAKLAEQRSDQYNVSIEDDGKGGKKLALTDPTGEKVDMEDAAVKRAVLDAKIQMAKEHRAALREIILMGVTRLIVRKGEINASVEFTITANRHSTASHSNTNTNVFTAEGGWGGGLGSLFGGPSGSFSETNTNISVNTSNKDASDTLTASLKGAVKIEFATDYFKLDNFANMYADGGTAALKPANGQGAPVAPALTGK